MFRLCGLVIADVINEGKVLHFDSNGVILGDNYSLKCHYSTLKKHKEKIKSLLQKQSFNVKPIPLNVFNNYIDQHTIFQLSDKSWSLEEALNYNNIVVVTEEIEDENINSMRSLIFNLNETIEKLNQQITILQLQHKQQENDDKNESEDNDQIKNTNEMKKNVKEVLVDKNEKPKKNNIAWFIVVLLSLMIIGASMLFWREKKELIISQKQVGILEDKVRVANCLIEQASSTIKNVTNDTVYSDWVSTNHRHGSISFQDYNFDVSEGDNLSFGYYVSSEKTYDKLIVTLSFIDNDSVIENNLITVSGEEISHFTYHFDRSGHYSVRVKYTKDSSINKYKDLAGINNFVILRNHKVEFDSIDSIINQWLHHNELTVEERDDAVQPLIIRP
jgi:hypothetical protein